MINILTQQERAACPHSSAISVLTHHHTSSTHSRSLFASKATPCCPPGSENLPFLHAAVCCASRVTAQSCYNQHSVPPRVQACLMQRLIGCKGRRRILLLMWSILVLATSVMIIAVCADSMNLNGFKCLISQHKQEKRHLVRMEDWRMCEAQIKEKKEEGCQAACSQYDDDPHPHPPHFIRLAQWERQDLSAS